jgi:hypothetical protein
VSAALEDDTQPCVYPPCTGTMTSELDGEQVVWACGTCLNESYGERVPARGDTCQMGVPAALQQRQPPAGPVPLTLGRRPE